MLTKRLSLESVSSTGTSANSTSPKFDSPDFETLTPTQLYWYEKLKNMSTPELPAWQPISEQTLAKKRSGITLSRADLAQLQALSPDTPLNMILLASFYSLIYRQTNDGNITLFTVTSQHTPLPLAISLDHKTTFIDLAESIHDTHQGAEKNKLPLANIYHSVLSDTRNMLQATTNIFVALDYPIEDDTSFKHDYLDVSITNTDDGCAINFTYNPAFFCDEQIANLLAHLQNILTFVKNTELCLVSEIPLLTRHELEMTRNYNRTDFPIQFNNKLAHEVLNDIALEVPDLPFQVYHPPGKAKPEVMTYDAFRRASNQIANYLRDVCRIKPGDIIVVNLPRSLDLATFWFGVMKAGAVWMPLDSTNDSREELDRKITQSGAVLVIGNAASLRGAAHGKIETLNYEDPVITKAIQETDDTYHPVPLKPESPAYISHTSGTTSTAKAAVNSHAGLRNLLSATCQMQYKDNSRVFTFSLAINDPFINDFIVALATKGCVHFLGSMERTSPAAIKDVIRDEELTFAALPPEIMCLIPAGSSLEEVHIMGESPYLGKLREWMQAKPNLRLFLGYGPTEGSVMATLHHYQLGDDIYFIGKPVANTTVLVLNPETYAHCGRSMVGEIFIGGDCINYNSYANNPEKTEERFRWLKYDETLQKFTPADSMDDGAFRVYATGDNASYDLDRDGSYVVKFHGRTDDKVKIFNTFVDLKHIASQILEHPDIEKAVVRLYKDPAGIESNRLIAYVVPKKGKKYLQATIDQVLPEHLRELERKQKSEKKTPYPQFELLKSLPLSANGKVNVKKLPEPRPKPPIQIIDDADLRTKLTNIWASLPVDTRDTFKNGGGNSIMMAQLEIILNEGSHIQLTKPIRFGDDGLSENMTIESLATILEPLLITKSIKPASINHSPRLHAHAPHNTTNGRPGLTNQPTILK